MNLNDLKNNLLCGLGSLVAGIVIAAIIVYASTAHSTTVFEQQYQPNHLDSPYDLNTYQYSFSKDFISEERSSLIDNLLSTSENCPKYDSLLGQFISCSPGQNDLDNTSESKNQNRSTNVEQSS